MLALRSFSIEKVITGLSNVWMKQTPRPCLLTGSIIFAVDEAV